MRPSVLAPRRALRSLRCTHTHHASVAARLTTTTSQHELIARLGPQHSQRRERLGRRLARLGGGRVEADLRDERVVDRAAQPPSRLVLLPLLQVDAADEARVGHR
eukprot:1663733-Prymnesium_polylepis.1